MRMKKLGEVSAKVMTFSSTSCGFSMIFEVFHTNQTLPTMKRKMHGVILGYVKRHGEVSKTTNRRANCVSARVINRQANNELKQIQTTKVHFEESGNTSSIDG